MKKYSLFLLVAVAALSSCRVNQYVVREVDVDKQNIVMSPMIVDVRPDFTQRVNSTSKFCKTLEEAVQEARYMAIANGKIDVVVDPILQVEKKPVAIRAYRATLTGFAGFYENSRTLYEDIKKLKDLSREDIEKYLILHQPEVLKYMNAEGQIVNIYHGTNDKAAAKVANSTAKVTAAPAPVAPAEKNTSNVTPSTSKAKNNKKK